MESQKVIETLDMQIGNERINRPITQKSKAH